MPFLKIEVYGHKVKVYLFGLMILRMRKPIVDRMEKLKDISYDDIFVYEMPLPNYCETCGQCLGWVDIE